MNAGAGNFQYLRTIFVRTKIYRKIETTIMSGISIQKGIPSNKIHMIAQPDSIGVGS
jgi:hypothetical protein